MFSRSKNKCNAFTLAEVLITLSVIGVVAAISIPSLQANIEDKKLKELYRKAFAKVSIVWQKNYMENELEPRPGWEDDASNYYNFIKFMDEMQVIKDCTGDFDECWSTDGENAMWGHPRNADTVFQDEAGMVWSSIQSNSNPDTCWGYMILDVNGKQKPNNWGKDRFMLFSIRKDSYEPGTPYRIMPHKDFDTYDVEVCPTPPCLYTSLLHE